MTVKGVRTRRRPITDSKGGEWGTRSTSVSRPIVSQRRRFAASLALVDRDAGLSVLVAATPDIREQTAPLSRAGATPVRAILLTHAHVGHYAGLLHFGREAMAADRMPVYGSGRMIRFPQRNAPWSQAIEEGHLELRELREGERLPLSGALSATAVGVPHRREFSDTFAYAIEGPARSLLYLPDIDRWEEWQPPGGVCRYLDAFDVALIDGTFYSGLVAKECRRLDP